MSERLTVSLDDGDVERLRQMAGGQRKVGVFLSDVIAWLWLHREALQTAPLVAYAPVLQEWIPRIAMSPEEQAQALEATGRLHAEIEGISARIAELEVVMQAALDGKTEDAKALLAQQDSSQNAKHES